MQHRGQEGGESDRVGLERLADRLHSAAIHLLRRLRQEDEVAGLTAPRLSALSVIVFAGPISISALAAAEQVRVPTISRLVKDLETEGLVMRQRDPDDARVQRVEATAAGCALLDAGRRRRVERLVAELAALPAADRRRLAGAIDALERLVLPRPVSGQLPGRRSTSCGRRP